MFPRARPDPSTPPPGRGRVDHGHGAPRRHGVLARFLGRWWPRDTGTPTSLVNSRLDVRPPAPWGQADSVWQGLLQWLREAPEPLAAVPPQRLLQARSDFCTALHGLCGPEAQDLRQRGAHARSLRELWHLRPELYGLIARQRTQSEAERRILLVNRHFPVGVHASTVAHPRHEHDTPA